MVYTTLWRGKLVMRGSEKDTRLDKVTVIAVISRLKQRRQTWVRLLLTDVFRAIHMLKRDGLHNIRTLKQRSEVT